MTDQQQQQQQQHSGPSSSSCGSSYSCGASACENHTEFQYLRTPNKRHYLGSRLDLAPPGYSFCVCPACPRGGNQPLFALISNSCEMSIA
eukprot:683448-Pelagomonas_calceolata.AAC.2